MSHRITLLIAAGMLGLVPPVAQADGDAGRGRKLAYTCMGCHGIENYKNAYPNYPVPKLGGQSAQYIAAALAAYDAGQRWHPTMQGLASTLAEQDRADLGAWFAAFEAKQAPAQPVGTPPGSIATCTACHGQDGRGTLPENPTIAGQHADYLEQSLNDYRRGTRRNPIMGGFASALTKDEIAALAAYYARQPGLVTPSLD